MTTRDRKMLLTSTVLLTLALLIFGYSVLVSNNFFRATISGQTSSRRRDEVLQQTRLLREKLRPWAEKHQVLLRAMRKADVKDVAVRNAVWKVSPTVLEPYKGDPNDPVYEGTSIRPQDLYKPVSYELFFGRDRQPVLVPADYRPDAEQVLSEQATQHQYQARTDFYWQKYRDEPFAISTDTGNEIYQIWLSGRIMRQIRPLNLGMKLKEARSPLADAVSEFVEVDGPYTFLQ